MAMISYQGLCACLPNSIKTMARAKSPQTTTKVAITAGAKPASPSAKRQSGMPMYPVLEYEPLSPVKLAAAQSRV